MAIPEFSNEFDILYNNVMSNQAPGLNEYEKSVFLTKAQDEIIKAYFNPKGNKYQEGFDGNVKRQIDFSMITVSSSSNWGVSGESVLGYFTYDFVFPSDALMILNESIRVTRNGNSIILTVIPLSYNELTRVMSKAYKYPIKWQAWRLIESEGSTNANSHLIVGPNDKVLERGEPYHIRYVKRPSPIILEDLSTSGLSIGGQTAANDCELDPEIHHEILQRAVELAKAAYIGDLASQIALGQQSETEKGIVVQSR